jgi:putative ABC transport system permease protein
MTRRIPIWRRYSTFFGRNIRSDIEDEIKFHVEARARELVDDGWPPRAAEEEAHRLFGDRDSILMECQRIDTRFEQRRKMLAYFADIGADVRYALRGFKRTPGFTIVTLLTLAVGLGATAAIFSVLNAVLLRPLPYAEPERLVQIVENLPPAEGRGGVAERRTAMSANDFIWWRENSTTLSHIAMMWDESRTLATPDGSLQLYGESVSPALFAMRGVHPLLGRGLMADDERPDSDVVVLGEAAWRKHFNSAPDIVGRRIELDSRTFSVVGVMPRQFGDQAFWVPMVVVATTNRTFLGLAEARLADGVSLETASAEANTLGLQLRGIRAEPGAEPRFVVVRSVDELTAAVAPALRVLIVAVGVVLAIVCTNVANLLLVRGTRRQQEIAIRRSLGATRWRIARQVLTESVVLSVFAGLLAIAIAFAGVWLLELTATAYVNPRNGFTPPVLPRLDEIAIDPPVLAFVALLSVVTGVVFGLLPALRLSKYGDRGHASASQLSTFVRNSRLGHVLAAVQLACAMALLIGTGLLVGSFLRLTGVDPGFDARGVLSFELVVPGDFTAERKLEVAETLAARLETHPRVTRAGFADLPPGTSITFTTMLLIPEGKTGREIFEESRAEPPGAGTRQVRVSPGYLRALGARLVAGEWLDERAGAGAVLVSRPYADHYFPNGNAVGASMTVLHPLGDSVVTIVGVVDDIHLRNLEQAAERVVFIDPRYALAAPRPSDQNFLTVTVNSIAFAARTTGDPTSIISDLRAIARNIDPRLAIDAAVPMERIVSGLTTRPRFYASILTTFGAIAGFIAVIGLYGVLSYVVSQRTKELGIRMALGARRGAVLKQVLRQGALIVGIGVVCGIAGAAALTRYLAGMLYGLTALDPVVYALTAVAFTAAAMLAVYVPARRATTIDPLSALRYE